jgi:hypothetical protein
VGSAFRAEPAQLAGGRFERRQLIFASGPAKALTRNACPRIEGGGVSFAACIAMAMANGRIQPIDFVLHSFAQAASAYSHERSPSFWFFR